MSIEADRLDRVRGILLDVDGVLHVGDTVVSGAPGALTWLQARGIPFLLLTNTTTASRPTLTCRLQAMGLPISVEQLLTAPLATAAYIARRFPGKRCYLLSKGDAIEEFRAAGIDVVGPDGEPDADVVVIGGAEDELTYARLNHAYRLLLQGAKLVAMHRNIAWRTASGMSLDSGPFITALASASGVRCITIGKPAAGMFRQAAALLGLPPNLLAMIGDDAHNDVAASRKLGMTGILVRSGKPVGPAEETLADQVIDSIADLPRLMKGNV